MRDKFSTYSRTTVRLDKDLDKFVEEVARFAGVQKAVVFREALYVEVSSLRKEVKGFVHNQD